VVVLKKSDAACVGICLYGCGCFSEGYSVAMSLRCAGPWKTRRMREMIEPPLRRSPRLKQPDGLEEIDRPFILAVRG
jgi:hypothetical protein